jgi:peptide/nickel transport system substrate-binding protein
MRGLRSLTLAAVVLACTGEQNRGNTILFASGADLQSPNPLITVHPLAKQVQRYALLTTLVRYDSLMRPEPYLAARWSWSHDRTTLTMILHAGVRWHDGAPTTTADAEWTLCAARDPRSGYPRANELVDLRSVRAPDDSTLVLRFDNPLSDIPDVLTDLALLPVHHFGDIDLGGLREAPWNLSPVGNGPFRFVAHEPNRRWVFSANQDFPAALGGPPRADRFIVVVVDEPTTKLAALTSGELDFAGISPAHAEFVRRDPRLDVQAYPLFFTYGMVFNTRRPPFDDASIRRAVSHAIDRPQIVDGYLFGFGIPAWGPVPPGVPGRRAPSPQRVDRDSARALLAGRTVAVELLTVGSGEAPLEQMIQAQLTAVGFAVSIRQLELSAFLDRVYGPAKEFDVAVMGIPGDLGLGYLEPLIALTGPDTPAPGEDSQRWFERTAAAVFLYHARGVSGRNRRVRHVRMDLRGELPTLSQWDASEPDEEQSR